MGVHVCACVCLWVSVGVWGDREVLDVPVRRQELRTFLSATVFTVRGNVSADVRVRGHTPWCLCVPPAPSRGRVCRAGAWVQASVWERVRARPPRRSMCTRARARRRYAWYTLVCVCVCVCVCAPGRACVRAGVRASGERVWMAASERRRSGQGTWIHTPEETSKKKKEGNIRTGS